MTRGRDLKEILTGIKGAGCLTKPLDHNLTTVINTRTTYIGLQVTMATILRFDDSLKWTYSNNEINYSNMLASVGDSTPTSHMAAAE